MLKLHANPDINTAVDATPQAPVIALLPWGHVWEDFLDSIGVSLESFCKEGPGGWMLGYMHSLHLAGVRTVLVLISSQTSEPKRFHHEATGATILVLPVSKSYLTIRHYMIAPYPSFGGSVEKLFGKVHGFRRILFKVFKEIAPYLTTPVTLLSQELQKEGCSAILCQEYEYFRFDVCVLTGRWMRIPVFASFQGTSSDSNPIARLARPLAIKACTGLVIGPQSEIQRVQAHYGLSDTKIAQIFNPIDLASWVPLDRTEVRVALNLPINVRIVMWHGRVEINTKGLDVLLDAWEQICCERPEQDLMLLLVGMGTDADKLRQRLASLQNQNVTWIDKYVDRPAIRQFLSASDVYAFPSRIEGFPVAPIEAMAHSLPIVAAQASGIPDIVKDGEASGGIVVPCGDSIAFASALGRVLDNEALRQEWGKRARHRVEEYFSLEVVGQQLRDFLLKQEGK